MQRIHVLSFALVAGIIVLPMGALSQELRNEPPAVESPVRSVGIGRRGEAPSADVLAARSCGELAGTFLGSNSNVAAYSNGCTGDQNGLLNTCGVNGIKWQCVEYVRRWWRSELDVCMGQVDYAGLIWDNITTVTNATTGASLSVDRYANGSTIVPLFGDLLVYSGNPGHVAVIVEVNAGAGYVRIAEQNWSNVFWPGDYSRQLALSASGGHYTVAGTGILGWKRVSGAVPPSGTSSKSWLFSTDGNTEGWTTVNIAAQVVSGGIWTVNPNSDPQLRSPVLNRPPSSVNYLRLGMKNKGGNEQGQLFYSAPGLPYSESRSRVFANPNNASSNWLTVRLNDIPSWNSASNIDQIRIDPVQNGVPVGGNDDVLTDYIFLRMDGTNPSPPEILSVSPSGWTNVNSFAVGFRGNDPPPEGFPNPVGPDVYGSGVDYFWYRVGAAAPTQKQPDGFDDRSGWTTATVTVSALTQGANAFYVYSVDATDHVGSDATATLYYDNTLPANPTAIASSSHSVGVWSADPVVSVSWSGAADAHSGISGYSWSWTSSSGTVPDASQDGTGTSTTSPTLASGTWYFHVRSRDIAGNWASGAAHYGPFQIDAVQPTNPTMVASSTHIVGVWSVEAIVAVSWSGASDAHSGVSGYSWSWTNLAGTVPDATQDGSGASVTSPTLATGVWHFHVRTRDNVGNWASGATHYGPFQIDTISPANPTAIASSSHTVSIPSCDATIDVSWSGASDANSGISGYSWDWTSSPATIPDAMQDGTGATATSPTVTDGNWYFHVRSRDAAGNWASGAAHEGPYVISSCASPGFTDVTQGALADGGHSTGAAWLNLDADQDLDLFVPRGEGEQDRVYENQGSGVFSLHSPSALEDQGFGQGMDWGDYDNDGDLDLYLVKWPGANRLFRNDGAWSFSDVTTPPLDHGNSDQGAAWIDYDRDGLLDLFLTTHLQPNHLFRNLGGGSFVEATPAALAISARCAASAWSDYDNDGDSDAYISNAEGPDHLVRNDGGGSFTDVTVAPLNDAGTGQGVAWADYDNDGDMDLYVCNFGQPNRLFRNDNGTFVDVATGSLADANESESGTWADYDNDGDLDLALTNFGQPSHVLRNDGGNSFVSVATIGDSAQSLGAAWGDYDEDGDEDLFVANYGSGDRLFRNDTASGNNWLEIALQGTLSNRAGIGARVVVVGSGLTQIRDHGSNRGFWSLNAPVEHFGLGAATSVDVVKVRWPSGVVDSVTNVAVNERITIVENATPHPVTFTDFGVVLPGVYRGSVAWGDYDNDGDLDILLTGEPNGAGQLSVVLRNDGGSFGYVWGLVPWVNDSDVEWGDYDNDGDLDVLLTGWTASQPIAHVYRNDAGNFTDINAGLLAAVDGSAAWGDYDNDGDLDILLSGWLSTQPVARVYRNSGGNFTDVGAGLLGVASHSAAWGDYDNDADLDILLVGFISGTEGRSQVYRNDGGTFVDAAAGLPGLTSSSAAWEDIDNEGDLDIVLTGWNASQPISRVYRNDPGSFIDIDAGLAGVFDGSMAWADYDNDGDPDLLLTGSSASGPISQVYRNDAGSFADIVAGLPGVSEGSVAWGDYDDDGDLDMLLTGSTTSARISRLYRSDGAVPNTPPMAPTGLLAELQGNQLALGWTAPTDAQTSSSGLSYNLRIGTTPGGNEVSSGMAAGDGYRRVARVGNAQHRTSWRVTVPAGTYYWSVQALDGAFAGSLFAAEQTFAAGVDARLPAEALPTSYALHAGLPNPFSLGTTIRFELPSPGPTRLEVFNIMGQRVRMLMNRDMQAGRYSPQWDGRDGTGLAVSPGVYFVRFESGPFKATRKVVRTR